MSKNNFKKKEKIKRKPLLNLEDETKKSVVAILIFVLALLAILSAFDTVGVFGRYFYKFGVLIFGKWGYFLLPLALILVGVAIFKSLHKNILATSFVGIGVFLLGLLGLFQLVLTERLVSGNGGGYIGFAILWPLQKVFGLYAAYIILFALVLISILITFNVSLKSLLKKLLPKKPENLPADNNQPPLELKEPSAISSFMKKVLPSPSFKVKTIDDLEKEEKQKKDDLIEKEKNKKEAEQMFNLSTKFSKDYKMPPIDLLEGDSDEPTSGDIKANANIIRRTLQNFNIEVEMAEVNIGPTVTQYTLRPAQGVKLSKITTLQNDLALALAARSIRIEAPIPGRSLVGIEIPNKTVAKVRLKNLIELDEFSRDHKMLTIALGRDVAGAPVFADLERMPHLLIAGSTGTGKTICLNSIIISLLYRHAPSFLKLILIDPKRVEFPVYSGLPHLAAPVIVNAQATVNALRWAVSEMENRFEILAEAKARDILTYNKKFIDGELSDPLPYIVIIVDELADLMASNGREVEASVVRLAQMARAVGIHLVLATQRPSVEVITGLIKANITSRIAFQVASQIDSRTILDTAGAEKLLGNGDMLFLSGDSAKPKRVQGSFVSDKEVRRTVEFLAKQAEPDFSQDITQEKSGQAMIWGGRENDDVDEDLYEEAKKIVIEAGRASASLLQRRLRIGYARAARILDIMEDKGIVGPANGAKPREVYLSRETGEEYFSNEEEI